MSANDYGNFLITTATIIRKIQPHAKIFGQYCCKLEFLNDFLQVVSDQGIINNFLFLLFSFLFSFLPFVLSLFHFALSFFHSFLL